MHDIAAARAALPAHLRDKRLLTRSEQPAYILGVWGHRVRPSTLAKWAHLGTGPDFQKFNRTPMSSPDQLDQFMMRKLGLAETKSP